MMQRYLLAKGLQHILAHLNFDGVPLEHVYKWQEFILKQSIVHAMRKCGPDGYAYDLYIICN